MQAFGKDKGNPIRKKSQMPKEPRAGKKLLGYVMMDEEEKEVVPNEHPIKRHSIGLNYY